MPRINLFEFEDLPWIPSLLRNASTDFLHTAMSTSGIYDRIFPEIVDVINLTHTTRIIDLCSGGGGPIHRLITYINTHTPQERQITITLTDLYPNTEALKLLCQNNPQINYIDYPVNATNVPGNMKGMRTIFTGFHHLPPDLAKSVLKNCMQCEEPIGIFEVTERSFLGLMRVILGGLIVPLAVIPFTQPRSLKKVLVTPIAALMLWWDGFVSCLRTYSIRELQQMVTEVDPHSRYHWQIGRRFSLRHLCNVTYLLGYKK